MSLLATWATSTVVAQVEVYSSEVQGTVRCSPTPVTKRCFVVSFELTLLGTTCHATGNAFITRALPPPSPWFEPRLAASR